MRDVEIQLPDRRLRGQWLNERAGADDPWAPTLVFLHEGLGCVDLWQGFPGALCVATGLRGFAYDRTGYGRSGPWPAAPGARYLSIEGDEVLPQVLDAVGITACLLVGHADGGTVALIYASSQPPLLRGLVTIGAHVVVEARTLAMMRRARDEFRTGGMREGLARFHGDHVDAAFHVWNDAWLSTGFVPMDADRGLPRVRVPVLAMQGEYDEYATPVQLAAIARGVSGRCETVVVPGCGHGPHRQSQAIIVDRIARFVATLWRGPGTGARRAAGALALAASCALGVGADVVRAQGCETPEVAAAFQRASEQLQRLEDDEAASTLQEQQSAAAGCPSALVAALAVGGWRDARRLASVGGAPEALGPVSEVLARLDALAGGRPATSLDAQASAYARAVIRAAVAAAQDERDEMQVYLAYARDLAVSLEAAGVPRVWPLPIDEVDGELWLEVDRFADARRAFERAPAGSRRVVGLARTLRRLDDRAGACAAYRRAVALELGEAAAREVRAAVIELQCP